MAFGRRLHQAKVDGHQVVIVVVRVCDTGAAVAQPETPQPLGQVARKGPPTAFADNWAAGSVDLSAQGGAGKVTEKAGEMTQQLGTMALQVEAMLLSCLRVPRLLTLRPYQGKRPTVCRSCQFWPQDSHP